MRRARKDSLEGFGGGFEEEVEEVAAFAEDAAEDFGDGEDELAVGDFVADGGGDPVGGLADAALVAGGAEVAAFAGEGEEAFVAAVGAVEAEKAGGEVAAAEEIADGGEDVRAERAEGGTVVFLVGGDEGVPGGGEDLPEWARRGGGGVGRWMAQKVFIRTIFVRGKIGGDGSDLGKVRVGEFLTGEKLGGGAGRAGDGLRRDATTTLGKERFFHFLRRWRKVERF